MTVPAGTRFGVYEIVAPLGAGGMGEVYKARDPRLDRLVALKTLPREFANDATARERFEREAWTASALDHPNILSVFDVGRDAGTDYLVTELVEGTTLRERLAAAPLPPREVVHLGAQVADGLAAAHGAGLIHRDLKPENVMVTRDGRVKVLDFGLAKPLHDSQLGQETRTGISHAGLLVGTVGYIAPEQVRGEPGDTRSDLFALGVVLYEMTSGRRAFDRPTTVEVLNAVLKEDAAELGAHTPEGLRQIIGHCLEKDPARRFQSAADVAFALRALAGGSTASGLPVQHPPGVGGRMRVGRGPGVVRLGGERAARRRSRCRRRVDLEDDAGAGAAAVRHGHGGRRAANGCGDFTRRALRRLCHDAAGVAAASQRCRGERRARQ